VTFDVLSTVRRFLSHVRLLISGWGAVSSSEYHHFRNVIFSTSRGSVEIDRVIASRFGLFVIEDKKRSGWIFGEAFDHYWTSVNFRKKYRFQNPLHQNFGHVKALEEFLGIGQSKMHPLVVFHGRFKFRTPVPQGVFLHSCASWISDRRDVVLGDADVDRIVDALKKRTTSGFFATRRHASSVRARYRSDTTCPKCGGHLVPRVARRGPTPGSRFLGCSNYPGCKYIRN
jgi:restriction system protein